MPGPRIDVMLVDDHAVVRMGFRLLVDGAADMRVVAEAASGEDAVRVIEDAQPDVVVMDLSLAGIGGGRGGGRPPRHAPAGRGEAGRGLVAKAPGARVLVLSAHEDAMHARRTLKAGAAGYLTKRSAAEALIEAIREVYQGRSFLEPLIAKQVTAQQARSEPLDTLSEKEFKVFIALAG